MYENAAHSMFYVSSCLLVRDQRKDRITLRSTLCSNYHSTGWGIWNSGIKHGSWQDGTLFFTFIYCWITAVKIIRPVQCCYICVIIVIIQLLCCHYEFVILLLRICFTVVVIIIVILLLYMCHIVILQL